MITPALPNPKSGYNPLSAPGLDIKFGEVQRIKSIVEVLIDDKKFKSMETPESFLRNLGRVVVYSKTIINTAFGRAIKQPSILTTRENCLFLIEYKKAVLLFTDFMKNEKYNVNNSLSNE